MQTIHIQTEDGTRLVGTHFSTGEVPRRACALIAPAMGVPQRFYQSFAAWLATQGVETVTVDLRGIGASLRGALRHERADLLTWAQQDLAAALRTTRALAPEVPLLWVGHSFGGQILPFVEGHQAVAQVLNISAGSGYWRQNAPVLRRRVWMLWWGVMPASIALVGYFPGGRLGVVGDLPRRAAMQWRRWCLHPEYVVGVLPDARDRYAAVRVPIESIWSRDDRMLSEDNVSSLNGFYTNAAVTTQALDPAAFGVDRIDHMGFFYRKQEASLWQPLVAPLLDRLAAGVVRG